MISKRNRANNLKFKWKMNQAKANHPFGYSI